jgi:hypothetical protein
MFRGCSGLKKLFRLCLLAWWLLRGISVPSLAQAPIVAADASQGGSPRSHVPRRSGDPTFTETQIYLDRYVRDAL